MPGPFALDSFLHAMGGLSVALRNVHSNADDSECTGGSTASGSDSPEQGRRGSGNDFFGSVPSFFHFFNNREQGPAPRSSV